MILPSLNSSLNEHDNPKPRILMLEIKDKNFPNDQTLGWLLVEREETYQHDFDNDTIYKASIRLSYEQIMIKENKPWNGRGYFSSSYINEFGHESVSLTGGAVFLYLPDLYGQHIGTYLMNEIVQWAKKWPKAAVNNIELLDTDGTKSNKERRNRFYEQFGLVFDYSDAKHLSGTSRPMQVEALKTVETWKQNIIEHNVIRYLEKSIDPKKLTQKSFNSN